MADYDVKGKIALVTGAGSGKHAWVLLLVDSPS